MVNYWTSNKSINGLRHFVLVNETKEKGNITFLMVSVLDSEINLTTTYEELINSGNWHKGWINLSKHQSITEEYVNFKSFNKKNLNNWMNLTKKERYNLTKQDSLNYMDKRKLLLDEIRNEYKKISRKNSEGNIKKK